MAKTKATSTVKKSKPGVKKEAALKRPASSSKPSTKKERKQEGISFQQLLEFAPVAFIAIDEDSTIQFINAHAEDLFGYSREELINKNFEILIPERFRRSHQEKKENFLKMPQKRGMGTGLDIYCLHRNGNEIPVEIGLNPVLIEGKHCVLTSISDISKRKEMEKTLEANRLRESDEKLASILKTLIDGVVMVNTEGVVIFANPAAETLLGFQKEGAKGKYINDRNWKILDEFDNLYPLEQFPISIALREKKPVEAVECTIIAPDGEKKWLTVNAAPLFDEHGHAYAVIAGLRDITRRKRIEQQLVLNTRAMESVAEGIIITDATKPDNPIIYCNQGFSKITGYEPEEVLGQNCRFLQGPGTDRNTVSQIRKCIEKRIPFEGEILNYKRDGTVFWNFLRLYHITNEDNHVTHMVGFQSDITARKQAESQFQNLVEQNPAIIYTAGLQQHIGVSYISPQIKTLGFTQEEWIIDPNLWLEQIHPEDKARVLADIEQTVRKNTAFRSEYRLIAKDGSVRWFLDEAVDAVDENGTPLFRQGFMIDITARKTAEDALSSREHYLALLNNITTSIITSQDMDILVKQLVNRFKELLRADDCYMTRWDDEIKKVFPLGATAQMGQPYTSINIPTDLPSMTSSVIEQQRTLVAEDVFNSPYISPEVAKLFPARSMIGVPLLYGSTKMGAIIIAYNTLHKFDPDEVELAEQAGRQIAIAMWSAQQDFELKKRLKEQETLAQIMTTLSQVEHVGLSNVLNLIVHSARELIPEAQQAVIHLVDKDNDYLTPQAVSGYKHSSESGGKMRVGEGIAGLVLSNEKSIYIPSIQTDERFVQFSANIRYNSLLVAPIISSSQKLGTISIQSEKTFAFSKNDIKLLSELGQHAAIAIENTRLYDTVQQELKERITAEAALRNSEERYRSVSEDIPAMICRFLPDGTITYVNQFYAQFFGKQPYEFHNANLFSLIKNEEEKKSRSRYLSLTRTNPFIMYEVLETNSLGEKRWVQWTDRMIFSHDKSSAEYQSIGMDITARKEAEIERERLLSAEREQRLLAETSADATLALVSHVELDKVLDEILDQIQKLLPSCAANIALLEGELLRTKAWRGYENRGNEIFQDLVKSAHLYPLDQLIIENPHTMIISDTSKDPLWKFIPGLDWIRSHLCIPLLWNNQLLGLLYLDEDIPDKFSEDTIDRLKPLVNAMTVALESALLIETTRQALTETSALYHINQGLAALDADELLKEAVELLKNNFDYYHVQVFVLNPATGNFILKAASGEIGKKLVENKHEVQAGSGIVGYAAETHSPFFTNDVDKVVFFMYDPFLPETKAEMAIPVQNGEHLYGILDIQQTASKPFTDRDEQLVMTVADQLAVALHKAELYETLQTSLQQEKAMRNQLVQNERLAVMGRLLASVSHELNNPLQAIQNALFLLKEEKGMSQQGLNDLEIVLAESERMASLIERLRETYRPPQVEDLQPAQINNIIEDVYALLATHLRKNNVAFEFHPDPEIPTIMALQGQIRQVTLNLLMNAVEAMPDGGNLMVSTMHLKETHEVLLAVSDTGSGIAPSILPNIFDPFVTNKKRGTGIGLTISHDIVIKHRGRITAENNPDAGATFKVWLPIDPAPAEFS